MSERPFVDNYEILQISQTADTETVERVYRLLAKRYHPDNAETGNASRFTQVHTAYKILSNPERRAEYDVAYDQESTTQWKVFDQSTAGDDRDQDQRLFQGILSLLYIARRRDPESGGLGELRLERMLATPREHLAFPLWYLRKRQWIEKLDNGVLAITVEGVDKVGSKALSLPPRSPTRRIVFVELGGRRVSLNPRAPKARRLDATGGVLALSSARSRRTSKPLTAP